MRPSPWMRETWIARESFDRREEAGRRDDARSALVRALEIDPRNAEAHYNFALLEDEAGNKEQRWLTTAHSCSTGRRLSIARRRVRKVAVLSR